MLELTYQELKLIVLEDDDFSEMTDERFEIIHDDIPPPKLNQKNYKASDYIEDDGRRINLLTFIDHDTKIEYSFIYVFNSNDPVDLEFPYAVIGKLPNNITIVENSQF